MRNGRAVLLVLAIGCPLRSKPCNLACLEFEHTSVVGIIHKIADWIEAGFGGARITADRAAVRWRSFGWCIEHHVAAGVGVLTATLERVIEPKPMAHFVSCGIAFVVRGSRATWQRCR